MMGVMEQRPDRRVLLGYVEDLLEDEETAAIVRRADEVLDSVLDRLEVEEPGIDRWISDNEDLNLAFSVTNYALRYAAIQLARGEATFDVTAQNLRALVSRLVRATVAMAATDYRAGMMLPRVLDEEPPAPTREEVLSLLRDHQR